jgi:hypothetical protein
MKAKFQDLTKGTLTASQQVELYDTIMQLEHVDVSDLTKLCKGRVAVEVPS